MSVWYTVKGNCKFNRLCGLSIKTLLEQEMCVDGKVSVVQMKDSIADIISVNFEWSNSLENINAAKEVQRFIELVKRFDKNAVIDMEANIRFLA